MFNLAQYLEKFKGFGEEERKLKEALIFAVEKTTGVKIDTKSISIKNGEATIKTSPAIKNSIYIKKEQILKTVEGKVGHRVGGIR